MDQREIIGDNQEALRSLVETILLETWTCLPGIVQGFDPDTKLCVAQPAITLQTLEVNLSPTPGQDQTTPAPINMSPLSDLPVLFMGAGNLVVELEPQPGDECLIFFASRCIDGWWSKGGVQPQPIPRRHSLADGFVIVGPRSMANLFTSLGPGLRLRTVDGSAYIELTPAGVVNIVAPAGVNINGIPFGTHIHTGVTTGGGDTGGPV